MIPLELSANALAGELSVPPNRISTIVNGTRSITADTALRLARYFRTEPMYWLQLQNDYELARAKEEIGKGIFDIKPGPAVSAAA